MKALAAAADISYSTLKTAVRSGRISSDIEDAVTNIGGFDREDARWIDDRVDEAERRSMRAHDYRGRDTVENFRDMLAARWNNASIRYRAIQRYYSAFDPRTVRHELTDLRQSTPAGSDMQFFLTAAFQPLFHHSGIAFGFRKATFTLDIASQTDAIAKFRLGHPEPALLRDARVTGDGLSKKVQWTIEREGEPAETLTGEYATMDGPFVTVAGYDAGTLIISCIEVNIFDRSAYMPRPDPGLELTPNKQALIEQIFSRELPDASDRNGWIVVSKQESVIARYE